MNIFGLNHRRLNERNLASKERNLAASERKLPERILPPESERAFFGGTPETERAEFGVERAEFGGERAEFGGERAEFAGMPSAPRIQKSIFYLAIPYLLAGRPR